MKPVQPVTTNAKRHAFCGTHTNVEREPEQAHRHPHHITDMIDARQPTDRQTTSQKRIFTRLGIALVVGKA